MATDLIALRAALQKTFPEAKLTLEIVAEIGHAVDNGIAPSEDGDPDNFTYYMANATHTRTLGIHSSFTGHLPLVRYRLPATGNFDTHPVPVVSTAIGNLLPQDRKIASVEMVHKLVNTSQQAERVDILSPARASGPQGSRFGAFATYLCYTNADDPKPSWYILEGGTATGQPRVLYSSQGMTWIINKTLGYVPTAFSKPTDFVSGLLTMNGNEPKSLEIRVTDTTGDSPWSDPAKPYITVFIQYDKRAQPPPNSPVHIILEAAARLGVIGNHLHMPTGVPEDIAAFFGGAGLGWIIEPTP